MQLIVGIALVALSIGSFVGSLPREGKTAKFVGTQVGRLRRRRNDRCSRHGRCALHRRPNATARLIGSAAVSAAGGRMSR